MPPPLSRDVFEKLGRFPFEQVPALHPVGLFHKHWKEECERSGVFLRKSLNPARFPKLLPWVVMVEKEPIAPGETRQQTYLNDRDYRFRYRLCGTEYGNIIGRDVTGMPVGRLQPEKDAIATYESIEICIANNKPYVGKTKVPLEGRSFIKIIRSIFPMSTNGKEIDLTLSIVAPSETRLHA